MKNLVNKKKGIYLVSESATLVKGSGAYRHIEVGREYLSRHFNMELHTLCQKPDIRIESVKKIDRNKNKNSENPLKKVLKSTGIWHTIKDFTILVDNHRNIYTHYKAIKKIDPDFIYERSNFLNIQGLLISKWLGIPHFYENNGIKYLEHEERVNTWLNGIWAYMERSAYKRSSFVFFVGLWGTRLILPTDNWMNIENGIEQNYITQFREHQKKIKDKINICFVGSLMKHHGFHLLIEALREINTSAIHLHLIGSKLEQVAEELSPIVETTYHGFLEREDLAKVLEEMHVGVIPNARHYQSQMKLFDYGAAKCLVIAPNLKNLKHWFTENEILFFEKNNVDSLVDKLQDIHDSPGIINEKGEALYNKIEEEHTWEKVFERKANIIKNKLESK